MYNICLLKKINVISWFKQNKFWILEYININISTYCMYLISHTFIVDILLLII